jgi:hypothetical protein
MLSKRIDLGSIPMGIYEAGEELTKGRAVVVKTGKLYHPTTKDEAGAVLGLCTYRVESPEGGEIADHDTIPSGTKAVVYTLVSNNMWATSEFVGVVGDFTAGDDVSVSYKAGEEGQLVKSGADAGENDATPLFSFYESSYAGSYDMIDVFVK